MEKKTCGKCNLELPATDEFYASKMKNGNRILQSFCRSCQKQYRKEHYENNKEKYINKAKLYKKQLVNDFVEYKKTLKCSNCNEDRWWVLDFHHSDPSKKDGNISRMIAGSKTKLLKELDKCIVLCSNCHRDLHYQEISRIGEMVS